MTSPYDIEEIFPVDAAEAVRLARRQAGNSPQGLAVTLPADSVLGDTAEARWSTGCSSPTTRHRPTPPVAPTRR